MVAYSPPITLAVVNSGDAPSGAVMVTLVGADAPHFMITLPVCGAPLPAKGNCMVKVAFNPTSAGAKSVTLRASASPGGMAMVTLMGDPN